MPMKNAATNIRVRSIISPLDISKKTGRIVDDGDLDILLTGQTLVSKPNGKPLVIYLPGALTGESHEEAYKILSPIRNRSFTRGKASGAPSRIINKTSVSKNVMSSIIGNIDATKSGRFPYCRTTAWSGKHTKRFAGLSPIFSQVSTLFQEYVPDRYAAQMQQAKATAPGWVIPDTPFTTMTVNNTYPTGVHKDAGDLEKGFSCLAVWRRGDFTGGKLTFPEYRIGVDLQDGDLILMDAHEWHGNTNIELHSEDAERISLVLYFRERMVKCGTRDEEKKKEWDHLRGKFPDEEMDREAMAEFTTVGG